MLTHYQNQSCPELAALLKDDAITFSVLASIVQGTCRDIYTDHENIIICYSSPPYPIWVWCRDVTDGEAVSEITRCLKTAFPFDQGYDINMRYELLEQLKRREESFRQTKIKLGLLSYRLDQIQPIDYPCEGRMTLAEEEDIPSLASVWHDMVMEMEGRDIPEARCYEAVRKRVADKKLFTWRNDAGEILAKTSRIDSFPYCKVSGVYTFPQHRRKGYAINLVHAVTQTILDDGLIPILYTDANYRASNACYQKIGYHQVGELCCVCG